MRRDLAWPPLHRPRGRSTGLHPICPCTVRPRVRENLERSRGTVRDRQNIECVPLVSEPLDDGDVGLAAAFAHRLQTKFSASPFEFVQHGNHQSRTGTTDWMSESDRTTVGIDLGWVCADVCQPSQDTGAKASLISTTSMSSIDNPVFFSACCVAGIGAVSILTGSAPRTDM